MNYSANSRNRTRAHKQNQWFRRMFTVALIMGIIIGFVAGRLSAMASEPVDPVSVDVTPDPITTVEPSATLEPVEAPEPVLLGTYRITAYCACEKCCGEWAKNRPDGIVYGASGQELVAGVSCASPLPFGTVVEVEGLGEYVVQDRTAAWVVDKYGENQLDIYFDDHEAACAFGLQYLNVYLKEEPTNDQM